MFRSKRLPEDPIGIKTVRADLLQLLDDGVFDIVAHGCNCFHVMGAGFAKELADRHPQVLQADQRDSMLGDRYKLGNYTQTIVDTASGKRVRIANLYTQYYYGPRFKGGYHFQLHHLEQALSKLIQDHPGQLIGIPLIGAGYGQAHVEEIRKLVVKFQRRTGNLVLVEYP